MSFEPPIVPFRITSEPLASVGNNPWAITHTSIGYRPQRITARDNVAFSEIRSSAIRSFMGMYPFLS
jgi:hypothetical protein